jgi:alpha-L-fucosidase
VKLETKNILIAYLLAVVVLSPSIYAAESARPATETKEQRDDRMAWWREARFGMFIHWGPVSLKGTEISWSRANSNPACPNQGPIPVEVYDNLYKQFNPLEFDAKEWVAIAQASGMRYMVLTAKHCDGFCLWHSKVTDYNISKTPFMRDVCAELAKAAQTAGIRVGWYYSPMDWRDPDCRTERNARYVALMQQQLRELMSNYGRIDLLWFDTDGRPAPWDQDKTYGLVKQLQPHIIINNRLDIGSTPDYEAQQIGPNADYYTPEQRIGKFDNQRPWETCMTLGTQWSWKPNDDIKSLKECIHILIKCVGGDGNLLLNVGPMPNGKIEPRQAERLRQMGEWLKKYGRSIYGTRGGPFKPGSWGASTCKSNRIYLHILNPDIESLQLPPIDKKIIGYLLLTGGKPGVKQTAERITITVDKKYRRQIDTIVELKLDGPAGQITSLDVPAFSPEGSPRS